MRRRVVSLPLFWRVFAANAAVLVLAFGALVFAPVTVSVPVSAGELVILAAGLLGLLATNLALLRPAFAPLDELAETMRRQDPLSPGIRAELSGDASVPSPGGVRGEALCHGSSGPVAHRSRGPRRRLRASGGAIFSLACGACLAKAV